MFASMKTQKGKIGLFCRGEIILTTKQVPKGPKHSSWPCSHALEDAHTHISTWSKLQIQPGQRGRMRSSAQPALHGSALPPGRDKATPSTTGQGAQHQKGARWDTPALHHTRILPRHHKLTETGLSFIDPSVHSLASFKALVKSSFPRDLPVKQPPCPQNKHRFCN